MKRIITLLLIVLLAISTVACGSNADHKGASAKNEIEVAISFVENEQAVVVTRQIGDKEIKELELTCLFYDGEGKAIGEPEVIACQVRNKATFHTWTFVPTFPVASKYMEAVVSSVTYTDESRETDSGVKQWIKDARAAFSLESYQKKLEAMAKKEAVSAEKCDDISFSMALAEDGKMNVTLKNNSGKQIDKMELYILWFDEKGQPVDMKDVPFKNSEKLSASNLVADKDGQYTVDVPENAAQAKGVVKDIAFTDGTVWENMYLYEWGMVNHTSGQ